MNLTEQTIEIDYFKDLHMPYKITQLEINEGISEVTSIICEVYFFEENIWHINIPLKKEIIITIHNTNKEEESIKKYKCFVLETKKIQCLEEKSPFYNQYILTINCQHLLGKLSYSNNFYLWKNKTIGDVLKDLLIKHNLSLEGNVFPLHDFTKELIVQYGENDLHFFQRLLQLSGFFYVCMKDTNIIKVYNTTFGYEDIFPTIEYYNINKYKTGEINTIAYVNEFNILTHEEFIHRDENYDLPEKLESITLEEAIAYGQLYTYPSNSDNEKELSRSATNKKHEFVKKKYEGGSFCFSFEPCKRIVIVGVADNPYVIIYVKHVFKSPTTSHINGSNYLYVNEFATKDMDSSFVSNKIFKKPLVSSVDMAIVEAEVEGEEISLQNYGKVLVRFNWTKDDPLFHVWVPVAQYLAGKVFGSFIMPRVGHEVLIYFINGDPDRPVVYGGLHTKKAPKFSSETEDKYKTVLLRSHTFNEDSILSYNEISVDDKLDKQKIFFKAQKDLDIEIGHKEQDLEHHYSTSLLGKGYKKEFIQEGDNTLEMVKGSKIQSIGGNSITNIKRTESGGDYLLKVEDGKLVIEVNGLGDIYFKGPCKVHTDSTMEVTSVGQMTFHSDEKVLITSPIIEMVATETIKGDAGVNIAFKGTEKITNESLMISLEAGENIGIKSGVMLNMESAMELHIKAGMIISIISGLELSLEGGLTTAIKAGLAFSAEGGLAAGIKSGLAANLEAGLEAGVKAGLSASVMSGGSVDIMAGLAAAVLGAAGASLAGGGLVAMMI